MPDDAFRAAVWGDLFEIAVKRGCLGLLDDRRLLQMSSSVRHRWDTLVVNDLHQHLFAQTGVVDPVYRARQGSSLDHMLWVGWALGWTTMREYLRRLGSRDLEVLGVFCPLELNDRTQATAGLPDSTERLESIWRELALPGEPDELGGQRRARQRRLSPRKQDARATPRPLPGVLVVCAPR